MFENLGPEPLDPMVTLVQRFENIVPRFENLGVQGLFFGSRACSLEQTWKWFILKIVNLWSKVWSLEPKVWRSKLQIGVPDSGKFWKVQKVLKGLEDSKI